MQQLTSLSQRDQIKAALLIGAPVAVTGALLFRWWRSSRSLPPGPINLPMIGNPSMLDLGQLPKNIDKLSRQYKSGLVSFRLGRQLVIAVTDYELLKEMLDNSLFAGRPRIPVIQRLTDNCGIIFTEGESWSLHRRTSLQVLRDFGFARERSAEMVDIALDSVFQKMDSLSESQQPAHLLNVLLAASNSVISQLTFGKSFSSDEPDYATFCKNVMFLVEQPTLSPLVLYPWLDYIIRFLPMPPEISKMIGQLQGFIKEQIQERERLLVDDDCEADCLCDSYILEKRKAESKGDFETFREMQQIRVCLELFLAGTDTTARSVEWLLLYMASYPETQQKLQSEIDSVLGQSRRPKMSDRTELPYLSAVIDEGYRKVSLAATGIFHRAVRDTEFHGFKIPSDALILPNVYSVHHDDRLWQHPLQFDPGHFLDKDGKYKSSPHCIPFLVGKRSCVGESLAKMEVFLIFSAIMQKYSVSLSAESQKRKQEILDGKFGAVSLPGKYGIIVTKR